MNKHRGRTRRGRGLAVALWTTLAVVLLAGVAAATGPRALAWNTNIILGPPGYDANGDTLIVAGTTTPALESGDHVVICHALGMTNKDGYNQIAPSTGVVFGHAGTGHQAGEDIIPPFTYVDHKGSVDTSLQGGQNWTAENRLVYENGCVPPAPQTATLTVKKHVVGGTATAHEFTMHVDAAGTSGDVWFEGSESGTTVTVPVGAYTVTETGGPSHYTNTSSTNCEGTLAAGESKTCTIENTYVPPEPTKGTVVVEKVTAPAGIDQDFEFTIEPEHERSLASHTGFTLNAHSAETATNTLELEPGWYTITEAEVHGWTLTSVVCTGDDGPRTPGPASIHVHAGETIHCTFTNSTATLTVVKKVVGGTAKPSDFAIDVDAAHDATFPGSAAGTTVVIGAGPYAVSEHGGPANYTMTRSEGCTGTAALGAALTCTITNTYAPPEVPTVPTTTTTPVITTAPVVKPVVDLVVAKSDSPDPVAVGGTLTYTITVTNKPPAEGQAFTATDVTLVDPLPAGVTFVTVSPSQGTCTFSGGSLTCKLGSLAPAQTAAVVVKVRPTAPGKLLNSVVAVAVETELNPADNAAVEATTVRGPFTPPAVLCTTLRVKPLSLQVGHKRLVVVVVRDQRGKVLAGATVTVKGPGVLVRGATTKAGVYSRIFHPKKPGVLVVRVLPSASGHCLGRVGVVGVFQPPVTG